MIKKNFIFGCIKLLVVLAIGGFLGVKLIDFEKPFSIVLFIIICLIGGVLLNKLDKAKI